MQRRPASFEGEGGGVCGSVHVGAQLPPPDVSTYDLACRSVDAVDSVVRRLCAAVVLRPARWRGAPPTVMAVPTVAGPWAVRFKPRLLQRLACTLQLRLGDCAQHIGG